MEDRFESILSHNLLKQLLKFKRSTLSLGLQNVLNGDSFQWLRDGVLNYSWYYLIDTQRD